MWKLCQISNLNQLKPSLSCPPAVQSIFDTSEGDILVPRWISMVLVFFLTKSLRWWFKQLDAFYLDHWSWGWISKMFIGSHSITKLYWITQFGSISSVLSVYPLSGIVAWHKQNEEPSTDPQNGDTTLLPTSS